GLWGETIDTLPPHLRDWYQAHKQTVFDISLNFNHLALAISLFTDQTEGDAQRFIDAWADAFVEVGNAAFANGFTGGSAVPVDSGRGSGGRDRSWATPLQHGGIVTRPTLALLGEHGDEAVIPLGRGVGVGSVSHVTEVHMHVQGSILSERDLVRVVRDAMQQGKFRDI
ncbi:unnamed protein product, partial [marine sediment metagenome]